MKNSEKNNSKVNNSNTNINEVLSPENIKLQLKAACQDMNAAQTKEYIKGLDGYELRLTGQKPTQHYTVFFGEVRICNVEQVQGIKADGSSRGCISTAKVDFIERTTKLFMQIAEKTDLKKEELTAAATAFEAATEALQKVQDIFDTANRRAAERAAEIAKAKREAAARERATKKVGEKIAAGTDSEKIAAIAAALNVSYEVAATIYKEQKQTA